MELSLSVIPYLHGLRMRTGFFTLPAKVWASLCTQCDLRTLKNHLLFSGFVLPSRIVSVLSLVLWKYRGIDVNMSGIFLVH